MVTPLNVIKARAKKIRDFGIEEIDLSGGESSIHENWFEILDYCGELGFSSISCLSNGSRFSNMAFLKRSQEAGLSEILFSLHGWDAEGHDEVVGRKGAFKRMLKAIENAKELGMALTESAEPLPLSRLDHALYLGRELQKAELCLEQGLDYVQD